MADDTTTGNFIDDFLPATTPPSNAATDEYCSIPTNILDTFETVSFQNTRTIEWMHDIPPRYGKPNDVLLLMAGNEQQQADYLRGLLASSITMFVFFLLWSTILLTFKCIALAPLRRSNITRWLAGERLRVDEPPSDNLKPYQLEEWKKHYEVIKRELYCFRCIVLFAGLSIVVSAIVMSVGGTNSLTEALDSARMSIGLVHRLASQATEIIDQVIDLNQKVSSEIFTILEDVNGMCPLVRDPLCDDLQDLSTCDISGFLGEDLSDIFKQVVGHFAAGERSVIYQEIIKARDGLQGVQVMTIEVDNAASHFNWALILSMIFSLLLALLCIFIMSSLVFRLPKMLSVLKSRIMMPMFVTIVVFAYIFALLFVTASIATSDLCIYETERDNVDMRILALLRRFEEALSSIVVEFARFYIQQCPTHLLPEELVDQMDYVIAGVPAIQQFSNIVEESKDLIQGACGFAESDTQKLLDLAETAQTNLCEVADILKQVRMFLQCENWFPLYETTTYHALCYDGTNGFAFIASTQFVIVFMAFVIVTFRTAFWDIQIGDDPTDEDESVGQLRIAETDETMEDEGSNHTLDPYHDRMSRRTKSPSVTRSQIQDPTQIRDAVDTSTTAHNLQTTIYVNGVEDDPDSAAHESETSTDDNTDDDGSGVLILLDDDRGQFVGHGREEGAGVEVGHFHNRTDAWAIWARQFTPTRQGPVVIDAVNDNDRYPREFR